MKKAFACSAARERCQCRRRRRCTCCVAYVLRVCVCPCVCVFHCQFVPRLAGISVIISPAPPPDNDTRRSGAVSSLELLPASLPCWEAVPSFRLKLLLSCPAAALHRGRHLRPKRSKMAADAARHIRICKRAQSLRLSLLPPLLCCSCCHSCCCPCGSLPQRFAGCSVTSRV